MCYGSPSGQVHVVDAKSMTMRRHAPGGGRWDPGPQNGHRPGHHQRGPGKKAKGRVLWIPRSRIPVDALTKGDASKRNAA
eukprot:5857799-Pyramimonas_sp.AAC.1